MLSGFITCNVRKSAKTEGNYKEDEAADRKGKQTIKLVVINLSFKPGLLFL